MRHARPLGRASGGSRRWRRTWKIELIERFNPGWRDLFVEMQ
jgi:predicted GIY-YIG superfamily endonuclease